MTAAAPDPGDVPRRTDDEAVAVFAAIRADVATRAPWVCWGCIPTVDAVITGAGYAITVHHSDGCIAVADWLLNGHGPPPGPMPSSHHAPPQEGSA